MVSTYSQLSIEEKLEKNWIRTLAHFDKGEYSGAIVRCVTCLELATTMLLRWELEGEYGLPVKFVETQLKNAGGIKGKFCDIFLPLVNDWEFHQHYKDQWKYIDKIVKVRNRIVHGGEHRSKRSARTAVLATHKLLERLLKYYSIDIVLSKPDI